MNYSNIFEYEDENKLDIYISITDAYSHANSNIICNKNFFEKNNITNNYIEKENICYYKGHKVYFLDTLKDNQYMIMPNIEKLIENNK